MANYSGQNFTSFSGINVKGTIVLRTPMDGGFESTVAIKESADAAYAYKLPHKSGSFPIMGTFRVQLPALTGVHYSTAVTVSGIRAEDALVVQFNGVGVAGTTYGFEQSTGYILKQAVPTNGAINLYFHNLGNSTGYVDMAMSYIAMR